MGKSIGYTHYWKFKKQAPKRQALYTEALRQCELVVKEYSKKHGGISGYTAHVEPGKYTGIFFNGSRENGHEDFILRETIAENDGFNFCKTARKPYDILVVACLSILKHHLGNAIEVSSDGRAEDWNDGVEFAQKTLGIELYNPLVKIPKTLGKVA